MLRLGVVDLGLLRHVARKQLVVTRHTQHEYFGLAVFPAIAKRGPMIESRAIACREDDGAAVARACIILPAQDAQLDARRDGRVIRLAEPFGDATGHDFLSRLVSAKRNRRMRSS